MAEARKYPTGCDIVIQPSDPMHPGGARPMIASVMYVSPDDQRWIDEIRERSYRLAIEREHIHQ